MKNPFEVIEIKKIDWDTRNFDPYNMDAVFDLILELKDKVNELTEELNEIKFDKEVGCGC